MRKSMGWAAVMAMGVASHAQALDVHFHGDSCGYRTDYDVHVMAAGISFQRDTGVPRNIYLHGGQLDIDGKPATVSQADAARLRQLESGVRELLPEAAKIAREGLDIGFGALATVTATFAEDPAERRHMLDKINAKRAEAMQQIDQSIASGVWTRDELARSVEEGVGSAVSELVGTVASGAISAALSGDDAKVAALQARADSLDAAINKEVDARADKLGQRADALCPRVDALQHLQQQLSLRLADGSRLNLITVDPDHPRTVVDNASPQKKP